MKQPVSQALATAAMSLLFAFSSLSLTLAPAHAQSNTIVVSSCDEANLTNAINSAAPDDTIQFNCAGGSGDIVLSNMLTITKNLTIDGTDQKVILDGGGKVRVFLVEKSVQLTLQNITVANGRAGNPYTVGGGIYNKGGTVTITNSTIIGNNADANSGGGIYNDGTITINNSTISSNSAGHSGGIHNTVDSTMTITNSTISNNSSKSSGGGIANQGTLTITNSTISGNNADAVGAGIANENGGIATITGTTITGNNAGANGGGIGITQGYNSTFLTKTTIRNSTISGNSAGFGGAISNSKLTMTQITNSTISGNKAGLDDGGIWVIGGSFSVGTSIVAGNTGKQGRASNCNGTVTSLGYNLESSSDCGFAYTGDQQKTDPLLSADGLANNGGPTQTIALQAGSPAIGAVKDTSMCQTTDQRGYQAPAGQQSCDLGAYQSSYTAP